MTPSSPIDPPLDSRPPPLAADHSPSSVVRRVAVIGGGPAGLMAAETLAEAGHAVAVYDAMPSVGRKFLLAGIGGLNLTHAEALEQFVTRYGSGESRQGWMQPRIKAFGPQALRDWAAALGIETFVGSSGRVFPHQMKAAPLLRAWLHQLRSAGVSFHVRHRWLGWRADEAVGPQALRFATPNGERTQHADAVVLALGGGSWARLGSDGAWVAGLRALGIEVAPLRPANCGFDVAPTPAARLARHTGADDDARRPHNGPEPGWSPLLAERFAGQPLKNIGLRFTDAAGREHTRLGECVLTVSGLEGSLIYALSAPLRDTIAASGAAEIEIDLIPERDTTKIADLLARPRGRRSFSSHLHSKLGLSGARAALLRELTRPEELLDPVRAATRIKALPLTLTRPRPLDEAISSAGGIALDALDPHLMVRRLPGVFCCGEMLDWEAPTGGYLLTGCLATGRAAGQGVLAWLTHATSLHE